MNFRNNTQYIIGFIDGVLEGLNQGNSILNKLESYETNIKFVNPIRTEVSIHFRIVDQEQEDDYTTDFILVDKVTTKSEFINLVEIACNEMLDKALELKHDW